MQFCKVTSLNPCWKTIPLKITPPMPLICGIRNNNFGSILRYTVQGRHGQTGGSSAEGRQDGQGLFCEERLGKMGLITLEKGRLGGHITVAPSSSKEGIKRQNWAIPWSHNSDIVFSSFIGFSQPHFLFHKRRLPLLWSCDSEYFMTTYTVVPQFSFTENHTAIAISNC